MLTYIPGLIGVWVGMDARDRGWSRVASLAWGAGILLFCLGVLPAYFLWLTRPPRPRPGQGPARTGSQVGVCRYCGQAFAGDPAYCPHCSKQLKGAGEIHGTK